MIDWEFYLGCEKASISITLGATVSLNGPYWTCPGSSTVSPPRIVRASDKISSACSFITAAYHTCGEITTYFQSPRYNSFNSYYSAQVMANPRSPCAPEGEEHKAQANDGAPGVPHTPEVLNGVSPCQVIGVRHSSMPYGLCKPAPFDTALSFPSCITIQNSPLLE